MKLFYKILIGSFLAFSINGLYAQHIPSTERGDPDWRADTKLEGNNIRTSIFNFGQTGRRRPRATDVADA